MRVNQVALADTTNETGLGHLTAELPHYLTHATVTADGPLPNAITATSYGRALESDDSVLELVPSQGLLSEEQLDTLLQPTSPTGQARSER